MPFRKPAAIVLAGIFALTAIGCAKKPPTLSCVADRNAVTEGESVNLQADVAEGQQPVQVHWRASDRNLTVVPPERYLRASDGSAVFDSTGLHPDTYRVDVEAIDKKGRTSDCSVDIRVQKREQAPTVACEPSTRSVTVGRSIVLHARAADPNNDVLTYAWKVDGRSVTNNSADFEFGSMGRPEGRHQAQVTVTDSDSLSASCSFTVVIDRRPNTNPRVSLSLSRTSVYSGEPIIGEAEARDAEDDPISYSWKLDGNTLPRSTSRAEINTNSLSGGRHSVEVTATDDRGGSGSASQSFAVTETIVIPVSGTRIDNIAKAMLDEIALKMQQIPGLRARVTGHTDDRGSEQVNERAGQRRADAVRDYIVNKQNVSSNRIETGSAGESQPIADNGTEEGRKQNRRVEVELFVR